MIFVLLWNDEFFALVDDVYEAREIAERHVQREGGTIEMLAMMAKPASHVYDVVLRDVIR